MKLIRVGFSLVGLGLWMLPSGGCLSSSSSSGDDGGTGSEGGSSGSSSGSASSSGGSGSSGGSDSGSSSGSSGGMTVALMPDMCGYLGPSSNSVGVQGAWYAYGDSWGTSGAPPGDCQNKGMHTAAQCSTITSPPAQTAPAGDAGGDAAAACGFPQMTAGTMCLSGTGAKVIGAPPDYSNIFGIGIGLDFNNQNGVKGVWNATMNHVVGFTFHLTGLTGLPSGAVRVEFPTTQTDAMGSDSWAITPGKGDGDYTVALTGTAGVPNHLSPGFPFSGTGMEPAFDPTMMKSIQVHVATNTSAAIPVTNLCISNLTAVVGM